MPCLQHFPLGNGLDRPSLRKSGKNLDIARMDWSSDDMYEDMVSSELFALELTFRYS